MFLFGHIGITVGAVHYLKNKRHLRLDLRAVALLAIAPDLIDKPIALLFHDAFGNHTRLLGHTLLFSIVVLATLLLMKQKRRVHYPFILWCSYFAHMIFDRIWLKDLDVFFWPLSGPLRKLDAPILQRWYQALSDPYTACGEIIGLTVLLYLGARHLLGKCDGRFKRDANSDDQAEN